MNAYCVILCHRPIVKVLEHPRAKRFYLRADTADRAMLTASTENPQWRAIGIEPSSLFGRVPEDGLSHPTPDNWHAA